MTDNHFNVLDMADEIAAAENVDPSELFSNPEQTEPKNVDHTEPEKEETPAAEIKEPPKKRKEWTPDPSLLADMPEMQQAPGAVYNADEVIMEEDKTLRNLAEDDAIEASRSAMSEKDRQIANINDAMKKVGIRHFQIPDNELDGATYHVRIMTAAGDRDYQKGQSEMIAIFEEIRKLHPGWVYDYETDQNPDTQNQNATQSAPDTAKDDFPTIIEVSSDSDGMDTPTPKTPTADAGTPTDNEGTDRDGEPVKIVVDKTNVSQISWSQEEVEHIKKARTIELNIVEKNPIEFSSINEASDSVVDLILDSYTRKSNDNVGALPASQYRATFTGLSYAEVLDLYTSSEMNLADLEKKKWSICFNHMKNPSIGPFKNYVTYTDPVDGSHKRVETMADVPDDVEEKSVHRVSKYEDFLRKTSYLDAEFILWKVLCATAMNKEIISINCHADVGGHECGNEYDWVYNPSELLQTSSIDPAVLEAMKKTGEASSMDEILKNYNESPIAAGNTVTLPSSGIIAVYGHASAYRYINDLYEPIHQLEEKKEPETGDLSLMMAYRAMTCVKFFLIPMQDGSYTRISSVDHMIKIFNGMNEMDWQVIMKLTDMMTNPYALTYSMRDIVCPKCGNKSSIPIDSMYRLLFILAQSLSNVNVTLTKL